MSRVNVDFVAFGDVRFVRLASLLGYADHDHARSKVEYLWLECTRRGTTELPQWVVESLMGDAAPAALVDAELARWGRGRGDTKTRLMHICGAGDRCLWLARNQDQSSKAGKVRASNAQRVAGRFAPAVAGEAPPAETSAPAPAPAPAPAQVIRGVSGKPDPGIAFAEKAIALINRHAGTKYRPDSAAVIKLVKALVKNRHTPEQAELVIQSKRAWVGDPKMGQFFRPATLLSPSNFAKYLDDIEGGNTATATTASTGQTIYRQSADRPEAVSPLMLAFAEEHAAS